MLQAIVRCRFSPVDLDVFSPVLDSHGVPFLANTGTDPDPDPFSPTNHHKSVHLSHQHSVFWSRLLFVRTKSKTPRTSSAWYYVLFTRCRANFSLQVLELTDVDLDDSILSALGGLLFSASTRLSANGGAGAVGEASLGAGGHSSTLPLDGWLAAMARSIPRLHTLILGHCRRVSETALEKFLSLIGGVGMAKAGVDGREDGSALSCVRLRGCKALGNRGLAALCRGTRGGIIEIEVGVLKEGWGVLDLLHMIEAYKWWCLLFLYWLTAQICHILLGRVFLR